MNKHKNKNGFTLIELLVVISIIGLLASVVLVALNATRIKARDAKRVADLKQIRTALDLYQSDKGHYPITKCLSGIKWSSFDSGNAYFGNGICPKAVAATENTNIAEALADYMKGASDPKRTPVAESGYIYRSDDGIDFKLIAYLTPENLKDFDTSFIDTARCTLPITSSGGCTSGNPSVGLWTPNASGF